jgi:DNA mismatch repair protein MutL
LKISDLEENLETFGYRGEAIASIGELSNLKIISRFSGSYETFSKIINFGKQTLPQKEKHRKQGTTITVENLFFHQPLRRNFISKTSELNKILNTVHKICIPFINQIQFTLEDATSNQIIFQSKNGIENIFGTSEIFEFKTKIIEGVCSNPTIKSSCNSSKQFQFIYVKERYFHEEKLQSSMNSIFLQYFNLHHEKENSKIHQKQEKFPSFVLKLNLESKENFDLTFDLYKKDLCLNDQLLELILKEIHQIFESKFSIKRILQEFSDSPMVEIKESPIIEENISCGFIQKFPRMNEEKKEYLIQNNPLTLLKNVIPPFLDSRLKQNKPTVQ